MKMIAAALLWLTACGGTESAPEIRYVGCWHFSLDGQPAGGLQLSAADDAHLTGTGAYAIWSGEVLGTREPNGDLAVLLYLPTKPVSHLILEASGQVVDGRFGQVAWTGTATDHTTFRSYAFAASRCP